MIGWYVHHHGWGHVTRMRAISRHLDEDVTVFSSLPAPEALDDGLTWVHLPFDADPVVDADGATRDARELGDVTARGALHWAPIGHPGHQERLAIIAAWIARNPVSVFVVDVSVELTAFVRLLGVPTVVFAQPGERTDRPHALGYDLADRIVAPWAPGVIEAAQLTERGDRVRHVGAISRHEGRDRRTAPDDGERRALFLGRTLETTALEATIDLLTAQGWTVETAGARDDDRIDDVWPLLCRATVVVSAAGQNSVADLAAAGARAVVLPQDRPFGEQEHTGRALQAGGYASTASADSTASEVAQLVEHAASSTPDWTGWGVDGASARAASAITEAAS
ncbi:glycosyltransferase [Microbacterium sp. 1.5R]|uniref:glycosyltransferase n=1 Tax=Microbacterium sp. 1.5R TaxID=1916917 RepID=UPI0011A06FB7|nr:glycosyltransferase [Microbacterium sp. 1.5R]